MSNDQKISESTAGLLFRPIHKTIQVVRNRPVRRWASKCVRWTLSLIPHRTKYYIYEKLWEWSGLLPRRLKEFLKKKVFNDRSDISLCQKLNEFLSNVVIDNGSKRLVLIFSGTTFTESEGQRPTRFARELAGRGIPVIFAYWRWNTKEAVQISKIPKVFCLPIDEFFKDFERLLADERLGSLKRIILMEFPHPRLMEIVNYANACAWRTVYDVIDDWEQFHKQGQAFWYDRDLETYLLQNADISTVSCENLLKKMVAMGAQRTQLIPNAFEDWKSAGNKPTPSVRKGKVTIGYFGHLTSSWFDWSLVESVARRRPDWVFHVIGYGLDKRVASCDNILFLGRVEHNDLPAFARNWDVAMIPFRASDLSASVDPIKIYEYISLGLSTVVTGMPHLASYPGVIVAQDDLEFEAAVEKAAQHRLDEKEIEAFLASNRWSNRIDTLLDICDRVSQSSPVSLALSDNCNSTGCAAA